jgi:hypothetical protein
VSAGTNDYFGATFLVLFLAAQGVTIVEKSQYHAIGEESCAIKGTIK